MKTDWKSLISTVVPLLIITMAVNLASCGTVLYPERQGQRAGRIDPGVAVLDGIGLLFFIIPGVIAFAVDFSNHTIYLPRGYPSPIGTSHKYSGIQVSKKLDMATIENTVHAETGATIDLHQPDVRVARLNSADELDSKFALFEAGDRTELAP